MSVLYAHDEVHLGSENTLICYITGFYPPQLMVRWTRNNKGMTRGLNSSQLHINSDGSFYQFFTLKFIPQEGDVYTCTVEHQALDKPLTRFWGETQNIILMVNFVTASKISISNKTFGCTILISRFPTFFGKHFY